MSLLDKGAIQHLDSSTKRLDKGAVEASASADVTAPTVVTAVINTAGTLLTVTFDENVSGDGTGFVLDDATTLTYVSGTGTDTWVFTNGRTIASGETRTLEYSSVTGNAADDSANDLVTFTAQAITNNSTYTPDVTAPTISSATITAATTLTIVFDEAVNITTAGGITIASSGAAVTVSSPLGNGTDTLTLTLSRSIVSTESLSLSYDSGPGDIADLSANALASFTNRLLTNNVSGTSGSGVPRSRLVNEMRTIKQSVARNVLIFMTDSADHVTGKTGLTLTITASKAGAAFASISPTVTERTDGWYQLALTASHTDTLGDLALHISSAGADPSDIIMEVASHDLSTIGRSAFIVAESPITVTNQTTFVLTNGPANDIAEVLAIIFDVSDNNSPVVADGTYVGATKTLTLNTAPAITVTNSDLITLSAVTDPVVSTEIADAILSRNASNVEATAGEHTLCTVILAILENAISGSTLTIKRTNGTTTHATKTLTTNAAADPITGIT